MLGYLLLLCTPYLFKIWNKISDSCDTRGENTTVYLAYQKSHFRTAWKLGLDIYYADLCYKTRYYWTRTRTRVLRWWLGLGLGFLGYDSDSDSGSEVMTRTRTRVLKLGLGHSTGGHHTMTSHVQKILSSEAPMFDFVWQLDKGSVKKIPCDVINFRQNIRNALFLWGITSFFEIVRTSWTNPHVIKPWWKI